jgi:hypothetical protein
VTWPEVAAIAIGSVQVIVLAWIATRQAQVKRDLNGFEDYVVNELDRVVRLTNAPLHGLDRK